MVSVILPTYNRADTIEKSIKSVLTQTYDDIELIIVDDCSLDNTEVVVRSFASPKIKYVRLSENGGACHARNIGVSYAQGEYIAFIDSDDVWRKEKIEEQLDCLKKYGGDICLCKIERHDYPDNFMTVIPNCREGKLEKRQVQISGITDTIMVLAKHHVFENVVFDESIFMWQDYDWIARASNSYVVVFCDKILADSYYVGVGSITVFDAERLLSINNILYAKYSVNEKEYKFVIEKLLAGIIYYSVLLGIDCKDKSYELYKLTGNRKHYIKHQLNKAGMLKCYYQLKGKIEKKI